MQHGGYGGGPPGGQGPYPPGGQPPGTAQPGAYPGAPQQAYPGAQQQAPQQQAPQQQAPQQQAPQQQGYPAPQPGGYPGPAQPGAYPGAQPGGYPGAQQPGGYAGAVPGGYPGAPQQGYPGAQQAAGLPAGYPGAPQAQPAAVQGYPGAAPAAARQNSFGGAQKALSGASTMLKVMRIAFIAIGALCIIGGAVLALTVDLVSGVSTAFTGVVLIVVALLVLPKFFGMMGQATAMVDGLAAKERLAQTGIPASGRLLQVQQTGRLVNYSPEIQALVEVQHPQFGVYQVQTTAVVPQIAIPRAQPGAPVQVRVDPQNKNEIALVF